MSDNKLQDLEVQFKMHETQCEERWKTIFTRVEGVETRLDKMHHLILGGGARLPKVLKAAGIAKKKKKKDGNI